MLSVSGGLAGHSGALRFSGHETFVCRYAWLPKAYRALRLNPACFNDEDCAIVELGLGKNMVRSLRFWVEATGVATSDKKRGLNLTEFAHAVLGEDGFDPYLEDVRTLWLVHWNISSRVDGGLFAWRFLLNHWPYPELTRSEALAAFTRESMKLGYAHSAITLSQHLDAFLHTYYPARSANVGVEDSLDGPLVELSLLQPIGERKGENGRWETVFAFRREAKPDITPALFDYCLADFWSRFRGGEETLTLHETTFAPCSPGQVLKLPEDDIRTRLEAYASLGSRAFSYQPSAVQGLLSKRLGASTPRLADIYEQELENA
jgi:hypothetical protein